MFGSAITLMAGETVIGILRVVSDHHPVAGNFGDDGRCGDAEAFAIATDDCGLWKLEARNPASVGQHVFGRLSEGLQSTATRRHRGPIDIEAVNLLRIGDTDTDRERLESDYREEFFTRLGG